MPWDVERLTVGELDEFCRRMHVQDAHNAESRAESDRVAARIDKIMR